MHKKYTLLLLLLSLSLLGQTPPSQYSFLTGPPGQVIGSCGVATVFAPCTLTPNDIPSLSYLPIIGGTLLGNLLFTAASFDIGANGATRPRNLYLSSKLTSASATVTGLGGSGTKCLQTDNTGNIGASSTICNPPASNWRNGYRCDWCPSYGNYIRDYIRLFFKNLHADTILYLTTCV